MPQGSSGGVRPHEATVLVGLGQHPITSAPLGRVPLLVAVVIMASLGWVILARGSSPADGTVTFPSAPYWSRHGVVVNELLQATTVFTLAIV
jgi:hypothetical protein